MVLLVSDTRGNPSEVRNPKKHIDEIRLVLLRPSKYSQNATILIETEWSLSPISTWGVVFDWLVKLCRTTEYLIEQDLCHFSLSLHNI